MSDFKQRLAELQSMIDNSNKIVFFGGAGVSTESGIPDFRSKNGLYNQKDVNFEEYEPEYLLSKSCLYNNPTVFYEFYRQKLDVHGFEPNVTHKKLAELEAKGKMLGIITQNIDGLHQKAGSKKVYEIHGTTARCYCHKCGEEYDDNYIFNYKGKIPYCEKCGKGYVRPDVVLYGETLPQKAINKSVEILNDSDLLIIAGTSLTVYPAAGLISEYYGDKMAIINRDQTQYDKYADIVFREELGEVFSNLK